jgi:cytidylate kinase
MEGRDVGTKIFPDADVKIFLDAAPHVRVARRLNQEQGATASALAAEISERDKRDRMRAASPLVPAADAVVLDTSNMSVGDVVGCIEEIISSTSQALPRRSTEGN